MNPHPSVLHSTFSFINVIFNTDVANNTTFWLHYYFLIKLITATTATTATSRNVHIWNKKRKQWDKNIRNNTYGGGQNTDPQSRDYPYGLI